MRLREDGKEDEMCFCHYASWAFGNATELMVERFRNRYHPDSTQCAMAVAVVLTMTMAEFMDRLTCRWMDRNAENA